MNNVFGGMTLKALLENPDLQRAPSVLCGVPTSKTKKADNGSSEVDFTSAFLGPQLWDKTYNASDFNLEYMDLDEFLGENMTNIPIVENPALDELVTSPGSSPHRHSMMRRGPVSPCGSPRQCVTPPHISPHGSPRPLVTPPHVNPHGSPPHMVGPPLSVSPPQSPCSSGLQLSPKQGHRMAVPPNNVMSPAHFLGMAKAERKEDSSMTQKPGQAEARATSPSAASTSSTPPVSPLPLQVDFSLTEQDIALSSVPGQHIFDPTSHTFTEDELKPQPMIKKSKKVFVPDDLKDEKYWARRKKNNYAAKRSRDARRVKENQIAMRAAYLEKENGSLRDEMEKIRRENARLKHRLSKYESA